MCKTLKVDVVVINIECNTTNGSIFAKNLQCVKGRHATNYFDFCVCARMEEKITSTCLTQRLVVLRRYFYSKLVFLSL